MEIEILKFLAIKARKISLYENNPRTDEQYLNRRMGLLNSYRKAEKNYFFTSDKHYLKEMKKIRGRLIYNVSRTEYEECKKLIKEYRTAFREIDAEFWNYKGLISIYFLIHNGVVKTLKEAVERYRVQFNELKRLEEFKRYLGVKSLIGLDMNYIEQAFEEFLLNKR